MNVALIFAGGTGQRMNSRSKPKQFLEMHGKPILIYTLEYFEEHADIDAICIVCLEGWERELRFRLDQYGIKKVRWITAGGSTGHESIFFGLKAIESECREDDIVLIHDGVRPLISEELISKNIEMVKKYGNSITVEKTPETIAGVNGNGEIANVPKRDLMRVAKAPQSFFFKDIMKAHIRAREEGFHSIDSCQLMNKYGYELHTVESTPYNIKIATPADYYVFRALYEARENSQIFGI
jgi:4-diphosphocytidyl-2-methyl-D-erithritol synthase